MIDILCRVVDNLGDIGVVRRLARTLSDVRPDLRLRLIVDDLEAFSLIDPAVDPAREVQELDRFLVARWDFSGEEFFINRPRAVVETFGCGFPPWYEKLLFDPDDVSHRLVADLEYLSAEAWAADYHLLPAPARHSSVRKITVMPGFRPGTGGLIRDRKFLNLRDSLKNPAAKEKSRRSLVRDLGLPLSGDSIRRPWIFMFTYEYDWRSTIRELSSSGIDPMILVAAGRGADDFMNALNEAQAPVRAVRLPFVPQEIFDALLLSSDFLIIRGEETLARASLSGIPFLWQTYPLRDAGHMEKLDGLLEVLTPHLSGSRGDADVVQAFRALNSNTEEENGKTSGIFIRSMLSSLPELSSGYTSFSIAAESTGDITLLLLSIFTDFV